MEYIRFIKQPSIQMYPGIKVNKDTDIEYKNENVEQTIKNLVMHSITKIKNEDYESTYDTTIYLKDGDVLIFEDEERGYIKPVENMMTITEAIEELDCIKEL